MTQQPSDAIMRRIRALKETAERGGSENEMAIAAEKLAAELGKYNLSHADVEDGVKPPVGATRVRGKYNETWRQKCYQSAAEMYFCHHYFQSVSGNQGYTIIHSIVGEPHNVAVAVEMGAYFEATINRLANESARTAFEVKISHTHRHRYIRSFRLAAVLRLRARIKAFIENMKKGSARDETGANLPALQSLFDRSLTLYEDWKVAEGISVKNVPSRDQLLSAMGKAAGRAAGDSISLQGQLTAGSRSSRFALK